MLSAAGDKTNRARRALEIADEGPGDALFRHALCRISLRANLDDRSPKLTDSSGARQLRTLIRIHILDAYLGGKVRILVQHVLPLLESRALVEIGDGGVLLEAAYDFLCLVGQAIPFVRGRVVRLVVAVGEHICHHYNGKHHQDINCCVGSILCLPRL